MVVGALWSASQKFLALAFEKQYSYRERISNKFGADFKKNSTFKNRVWVWKVSRKSSEFEFSNIFGMHREGIKIFVENFLTHSAKKYRVRALSYLDWFESI